MSDDIQDRYDLPDNFHLAAADHMDRVEAADGTAFRVLESLTTGEKTLVHADIVEYDTLDHPMVTGVTGFLGLLASLFAPLVLALKLAALTPSAVASAGVVFAGVATAFVVANMVLYYSTLGDWVLRFLEWNDHKKVIFARGEQS
ncbi:MAG: hypothetical protein ACOCQY_02730 [Halorhabdus sp.]